MKDILTAAKSVYGEDVLITGSAMSTYDISNAFHGDLLMVNLITLLAILLIVTVSFRSFRLPLLLVFVIEGAIWITMGVSFLSHESIFFVSYLICLSIQMGATIDYGILLCDQYRSLRRKGNAPKEALAVAMKHGLPTILTSGTIMIVAGYINRKEMQHLLYLQHWPAGLPGRPGFHSACSVPATCPPAPVRSLGDSAYPTNESTSY